jgi:transcriptional regulator GlxA family with amidase domain
MHRVAVVAVPPVTTFDLSIPELILGEAKVGGVPGYDVRVATPEPGSVSSVGGSFGVLITHGLDMLEHADTVIVTGTGARSDADPRVLDALRAAAVRGARIASICTGAFVLAQAGLLDGRAVTTYWLYSQEMRRRFPTVNVRPDVLYIEDGPVLTSAGLAAGIDLCLHLVRTDYGAAVANTVARLAVLAPLRAGAQAQQVLTPVPPVTSLSLAATREWAAQRLDQPLIAADLAAHARVSVRTLNRRFAAETGTSPLQWLLQQRVDRARELLESTDMPVEEVARRSGMGSADSLRQHLVRHIGLTPTRYRAAYRRTPATPPVAAESFTAFGRHVG